MEPYPGASAWITCSGIFLFCFVFYGWIQRITMELERRRARECLKPLGGHRSFRVNADTLPIRTEMSQRFSESAGTLAGGPGEPERRQPGSSCFHPRGGRSLGVQTQGIPGSRGVTCRDWRIPWPLGALISPRPHAPLARTNTGAQSFALDTHPFLPVTPLPEYPAPLRVIYPSGDAREKNQRKLVLEGQETGSGGSHAPECPPPTGAQT